MVDTSGFIIVHSDWITDSASHDNLDMKRTFITVKEPGIAKDLIHGGIMTEEECTNYEDILDQHYWRVS